MLTEETAKKLDEAMKILKTEGRLDPFIIDFIFDSMKDFDKFGKAYNKGAYAINMKLIDLEHRIKELEKIKTSLENYTEVRMKKYVSVDDFKYPIF